MLDVGWKFLVLLLTQKMDVRYLGKICYFGLDRTYEDQRLVRVCMRHFFNEFKIDHFMHTAHVAKYRSLDGEEISRRLIISVGKDLTIEPVLEHKYLVGEPTAHTDCSTGSACIAA